MSKPSTIPQTLRGLTPSWPPGARKLSYLGQMEKALRMISDEGCENFKNGWCGDGDNHKTPYAKYLADRWCTPCIARAALQGELPEKEIEIAAAE